jgi:LacI family transcriptional regulator
MKRATIEDIAQLLGISASTVSRALKDHPDISSETKQKVIEAARQLKYLPNRFAINLKKQEFRTLGVIVPEITHFFFSSVIKGIEEFCYKYNYSVLLAISNENFEIEKKNIRLLMESGAAGILMSRTKESKEFSHITELLNYDIPIVFLTVFFLGTKN